MPTTIQMNPSNWNSQPVRLGLKNTIAPVTLPVQFNFTSDSSFLVDFTLYVQRHVIDMIKFVYVDNKDGAAAVDINFTTTYQRITIPAGAQGYYPVLTPQEPRDVLVSSAGNGAIVTIHFLNFDPTPLQWATSASGGGGGNAQMYALSYDDVPKPLYTDGAVFAQTIIANSDTTIFTPAAAKYFALLGVHITVSNFAVVDSLTNIRVSLIESDLGINEQVLLAWQFGANTVIDSLSEGVDLALWNVNYISKNATYSLVLRVEMLDDPAAVYTSGGISVQVHYVQTAVAG